MIGWGTMPEKPSVASSRLLQGEAAVVIDLNSIVEDLPGESEAPRPVADAPVVEAPSPVPIPAGTQHRPR